MSTAEGHAADLLARGYIEVEEIARLKVGQRVRHVGEQYYQAVDHGTAILERIFHHPTRLIQGSADIEVIVKRDKPRWETGTHGFWADYHTVVVEPVGVSIA